jgi:molybdopterin molybdotransferase
MPGARVVPYDEALAMVLAACRPLAAERVPLAEAAGRVLATAPQVATPIPPFPNSAMDGYALRLADVPPGGGSLPLDPAVPAGTAPGPLRPGHAAPIATGGPVPDGADTIVPIEDVTRSDDEVHVPGTLVLGSYVRSAGSDLPVGAAPLTPGTLLDPAAGALLATIGATEVDVIRRPRVALLSTGAELVPPGAVPGPAQIRDSNSTALTWALTAAGAVVTQLGIADDDVAALRPLLAAGLSADLLVTTAGVSVGERDLVRATLADLGVEPRFWGVDLKPGKPVAFGTRDRTLVIALPGNPASSLVCSTLFAEPAVRALGGMIDPAPTREPAVAGDGWPAAESRLHAVRCALAVVADRLVATPTGDQRSHRIGSLVGADALALVEPGRRVVAGDLVTVVRSDRRPPTGRASSFSSSSSSS